MQVTKNEKIVKVVQEETYDIKGLTKAEAIALLAILACTNGSLLFPIYQNLDRLLDMGNNIDNIIPLRDSNGNKFTADLCAVINKIDKLAQK